MEEREREKVDWAANSFENFCPLLPVLWFKRRREEEEEEEEEGGGGGRREEDVEKAYLKTPGPFLSPLAK